MVVLKFILIAAFIAVFVQDYKARQVYWFLFPVLGLAGGTLFYHHSQPEVFRISVLVNIFMVSLVMFVIYLYAKIKLKSGLFSVIGSGDLWFFLALAVSFSNLAFIILFAGSLLFSLVLHLVLTKKQKHLTVPLAGYMSLFMIVSYLGYWCGIIDHVYTL